LSRVICSLFVIYYKSKKDSSMTREEEVKDV